jgi:putative transcriptional regulator
VKNNLRDLRTGRGWTQAEVAERLGISRQAMHALESGKSDPLLPLAFAIADLFEVPVEQAFERSSVRKRTK